MTSPAPLTQPVAPVLLARVRLDRIAPVIASCLALVAALWAAQPYAVGVFHDDGVYAILAKSIAAGEGYRYLHIPGAPAATHYPPGYPLLLAALWRIAPDFPDNLGLLSLANAALLALAAWGTWSFGRRVLGWPAPAALAAAVAASASYPLVQLSGYLFAEPLFIALLLPALVLGERVGRGDARDADAWLLGAAAGAVTLVKTHGAALVVAAVVVLCARRRWRQSAYVAAGAMLVLAPWQIWIATHDSALAEPLRGSYGSYLPWLLEGWSHGAGFIGATVTANVGELDALLADRFSLSHHALARSTTSLVVFAFLLAGAVRMYRRAPVTLLFAAAYFAVLLLWPFAPWRFVYAVWPLLILCIGLALEWLFELRARMKAVATFGLALAAALVAGLLRVEAGAYRTRSWHDSASQATRSITPLLRWVAARTRPGDVVAGEGEQMIYLFTGRQAVAPIAFTASEYVEPMSRGELEAALEEMLTSVPVTHLVTIAPGTLASAMRIADSPGRAGTFRLVLLDRFGDASGAFRVERPDQPSSAPPSTQR